MPFPTADILRERPPVPGMDAPAPPPGPPPPAPTPPVSIEGSVAKMEKGAALRQKAVDDALAKREQSDALRAEEAAKHQALLGPLVDRQQELTAAPLPEAAAPPELPPPPSMEIRPFLAGTPGEDPVQSLNKAVMGLSLLAQMGFGAASGVPELSLRALAGAMQGWQEGDILRGDREFKAWQGTVATLQKDYDNRRQLVEDIVERNRGDVERTRIALLTELARHGASQEEVKALVESDMAYFQLLDRQGSIVQDLGAQEATIGLALEARQRQAQMDAVKMQQWIAERQQEQQKIDLSRSSEGRKAAAQERSNQLLERALGGAEGGGPAGAFDTSISVGPEGPRVNLTPRKIGETMQGKLAAYDGILAAVNDLKNSFSDEEITAYTGFLQKPYQDIKLGASSIPGLGGMADKRYAGFKALVGRLTGTAFGEGGKQLTPFEASVVFSYTPTGSEGGGATQFKAKLDGLERYTNIRRDLTAYYTRSGVDPTTVPSQIWDQQIKKGLADAGVDFEATVKPPAGGGAAPSGSKRRALDPSGKPYTLPGDTDLSKYPGWKWRE